MVYLNIFNEIYHFLFKNSNSTKKLSFNLNSKFLKLNYHLFSKVSQFQLKFD
jgi:hypothetical protein